MGIKYNPIVPVTKKIQMPRFRPEVSRFFTFMLILAALLTFMGIFSIPLPPAFSAALQSQKNSEWTNPSVLIPVSSFFHVVNDSDVLPQPTAGCVPSRQRPKKCPTPTSTPTVAPTSSATPTFNPYPPPGTATPTFNPYPPPGTPTPTFNPYPPPGTPTPTFNPYPPPGTPTPTFNPYPPPGTATPTFNPYPPPGTPTPTP